MVKDPVESALATLVASGKYDAVTIANLRRMLTAQGKETLAQAVAHLYQQHKGEDDHYTSFVARAQRDGYWFLSEANLVQARQGLETILARTKDSDSQDYASVLDVLDTETDADLYAAFVLNIPEVREEVRALVGTFDNLYRVSQSIFSEKRSAKRSSSEKEDRVVGEVSPVYVRMLQELPAGHFSVLAKNEDELSDEEKASYADARRLFLILREKARRDFFNIFNLREDPMDALPELEKLVALQTHENLRYLYEDQLATFRSYLSFRERMISLGHINPDFVDPATGEAVVLPSFHQAVAQFHNLEEGRFGVFDECGTGKTAIAPLLKPLIEAKLRSEGKGVYGRTLVLGPKASVKAWRDGLCGPSDTRYFADVQSVAWVNGDKDAAFLAEMRGADFVFANFDQLTLDFGDKQVYEVLLDLGYDHLIIDEVQDVRNTRTRTKKGAVTVASAVKLLATRPDLGYLTELTGTPMPDTLKDYASLFFMLHPDHFVQEEDGHSFLDYDAVASRFLEIYEGDPRSLYTFVRQRTIRRRSCDVMDLPPLEVLIDDVALTEVQQRIVDYVFETGQPNWLTQMRYAVLDPRLVHPRILSDLDLVGAVSRSDSAKYVRLDQLLTADDGPVACGDKFVVFSTMFAKHVTAAARQLRRQYEELGLSDAFASLNLRPLHEELADVLSAQFGRSFNLTSVDGTTSDATRDKIGERLANGLDGVVVSTRAGGVSLNFSAANAAYLLDDHYSPAVREQAIARLARRGQKKKTTVRLLYGADSIDYAVDSLRAQKAEKNQMALDGIALLDEERKLISGDGDSLRLKELFLRGRGGVSVDLSDSSVNSLDDFVTKRVVTRKKGSSTVISSDAYEQTVAQELRARIMQDPIGIWHDEEFVALYCAHFSSLSPYVLARAKVVDLVKRARVGEITFPATVLADAAGPGILYDAFLDLDTLVRDCGFAVPEVVDRDFSLAMSARSSNPLKYVGDMCDVSVVGGRTFDFVDNSSVSLLENKERVRDYVVGANAVLDVGGYLQLGLGGWRFSSSFFDGMKKSGFTPLVKSHRYAVSKDFFSRLKASAGQHHAEAYRSKLEHSTFSLFEKVSAVAAVDADYFALVAPVDEPSEVVSLMSSAATLPEAVSDAGYTPARASSVSGSSARVPRKVYTGSRRLRIDPRSGLVLSDG